MIASGIPRGMRHCIMWRKQIRSMLRSNDALIRYGGDEFFLLFDNMPEQILERKLEELCRAVRKIEVAQYPELKLTISIGGAYASGGFRI